MKALITIMILLISSSAYAQETIKVIGLKNTDVEAVTDTLKNVIETVNKDKTRSSVAMTNLVAINKDDKDKTRSSTDKMAESIFKRIDADKNGSLSFKEFTVFYERLRGTRTSRGPQGDRSRGDRSDRSRGGGDRSRGGDRSSSDGDGHKKDAPKGFGSDKKDGSKGPPNKNDKRRDK